MTTYLLFDLGSDRDAYEQALDGLRGHASKPGQIVLPVENANRYTIAVPIHMKSELETLVSFVGRLVDELHSDPCTIELRHILEQIASDGTLTASTPLNGIWQGADAKYVGAELGISEIHHSVTIPKRGTNLTGPPTPREGWSFTEHPDAWELRLRKSVKMAGRNGSFLQREREKIASLYKGVDGAAITSRVEQIVMRWNSPLEPTEENQYRVSFRRLIGGSIRHLLDLPGIYAEGISNHEHHFLNEEELRARIIANLQPCRSIARAQGCTPLILGLGLIPVLTENGRQKFGNRFCVRGVSYGTSMDEAETLITAFDELIYNLVKFGRSPMLSPPERYHYVSLWRELLAPSKSKRAKPSRKATAERHFMSTMERVYEITPSQQFKPLDEVARNLLLQRFGAKFDLRDLGILGIPLRIEPDAKGDRLGGCLFALVHAPNLDVAKLDHLAVCESLFLHLRPLTSNATSNSAALAGRQRKQTAQEKLIQWAKDLDVLRRAILALERERPGARMNLMRTEHTLAYAVILKYSLQSFEKDVEGTIQIGKLMKEFWLAMTGKDPSYLFRARKLAGLPSLKPERKQTSTTQARAGKSRQRPRS